MLTSTTVHLDNGVRLRAAITEVDTSSPYARRHAWNRRWQAPRVFLTVPGPEELGLTAYVPGSAQLPYGLRGADPVADAAWKAYNRLEVYVHELVVGALFDPRIKPQFSAKAGCSCPCSPGVILKGGLPGYPEWTYFSVEAQAF